VRSGEACCRVLMGLGRGGHRGGAGARLVAVKWGKSVPSYRVFFVCEVVSTRPGGGCLVLYNTRHSACTWATTRWLAALLPPPHICLGLGVLRRPPPGSRTSRASCSPTLSLSLLVAPFSPAAAASCISSHSRTYLPLAPTIYQETSSIAFRSRSQLLNGSSLPSERRSCIGTTPLPASPWICGGSAPCRPPAVQSHSALHIATPSSLLCPDLLPAESTQGQKIAMTEEGAGPSQPQ
jgi:hypothetical protein